MSNEKQQPTEKTYHPKAHNKVGYGSLPIRGGSRHDVIEALVNSIEQPDGTFYRVGETKYLRIVCRDGSVIFDENNFVPVTDKIIIAEVERQAAEDAEIDRERDQSCLEQAKGDPILADLMRWNMEYTGGPLHEWMKIDGIVFYSVGHNASHTFYAGTKDGKKYALALDENESTDENGNIIQLSYYDDEGKYQNHIPPINTGRKAYREVAEWGYMGHY